MIWNLMTMTIILSCSVEVQELFELLDLNRPGLQEVRLAVDKKDWKGATAALARYMRSRRRPKWRTHTPRYIPKALPSGGSGGWDYFLHFIEVDFTGWRRFLIPFDEFSEARRPIGWSWIGQIRLSARGWNLRPDPKTALYIDDIALVNRRTGERLMLSDFEDEPSPWRGVVISEEHAHSGSRSALWELHNINGGISTVDFPHDWSRFDALEFWTYSPEATGERLAIILESDLPNTSSADKVVNKTLSSVGIEHHFEGEIDWTANPTPNRYAEWTWQLNRHPFWVTLRDAYWRTGDERYARAYVEQITHWIRSCPVPSDSGNRRGSPWRTIEAGIRMGGSWMEAFFGFLPSPSFTDEAIALVMKSLADHARHLLRWRTGGNWLTMEANGLCTVGVMFPEFKEAEMWRQTALQWLYEELDRQVYPDGAQFELTTGYHQVALRNFLAPYELCRLNGIPVPDGYVEKLERMFNYNLYAAMPDGRLPSLNDGAWHDVRRDLYRGWRLFPHRRDFLWLASEGARGEKPAHLSYAFPYAGQFVIRSGWDRDSLYMMIDAGPFGYGHQHEDMLSVVLYAYGRVLITEGGNYAYDSSRWRRYVLSTRSHNTIMVDGMDQHRRGLRETYVVDEPLPNFFETTPECDHFEGRYDHGYGPKRDRSVSHTRRVTFVKGKRRFFLVTDLVEVRDDKPHRIDSIFHLDVEGVQTGKNGTVVTVQEGPNLVIAPVSDGEISLEVVTGQTDPVVQGWVPASGYRVRPIPTPIFTVETDRDISIAYILYPLKPGEANPIRSVRLIPTDAVKGVAVEVEFDDEEICYLFSQAEGDNEANFGPIVSDGKAAFAFVRGGEMGSSGVIEGRFVRLRE
jgi:hypothetical protein